MSLLDDLPRGVPSRSLHEHQTPKAAFADPQQIKAAPHLHYTPDKIFLGVIEGEMVEARAGERYVTGGTPIGLDNDQHVSLLAGSRTGKGRDIIVPNLLGGYQGSALVVDPKGELANLTATFRAIIGQRVAVLDPFKVTRRQTAPFHATWNPMTLLKPESPTLVEDAGLIADALIVAGGERDTHWDESARAWIEGLILHVATWPDYEGKRDLITVRRLLMRGTEFELDD
ncbi:MAG: type IV secretory system conjugative DNA transfer family protein [Geminicoccaceae bacterium]